ncbi:MAG TPA: MFS transporter [Micropepsaceae bacterium]|jgi:MFS family permease|nr:MFS transporter [Micropepsaceae bacterium]
MSRTAYDERLAGGQRETTLTPIQETALKKAAWRLVPILTLGYLFSYLDRTCIGFAGLTMKQDLGLTNTQFGAAAAWFFASYMLCEVPSNMALYRFGARRWIARIMISWGLVSAAMALVSGPWSLNGMRFLLGIAEAGFFPGVTFYLAAWFPREYRTRILAWFLVAVPLSSLVGAPLCGLLLEMDGILGLAGWQWMFIMVSLPATVLGFVVLKMIPDKPDDATWLTREEADAVIAMRATETHDRAKSTLWGALSDPRIILLAVVQFGFTLAAYGVSIWLPLIIQEYHLSSLTIGFLAAIPYIFATAGMLVWARHVDRTGKKIGNMVLCLGLATIGLAAYLFSGSLVISLIDLTLALVGVTAARGIFWAIPPRILTGAGAAAGLAFINSIGTFGGFVGPYMMGVFKDATGGFTTGIMAMAGVMVITTGLAASLKLLVRQE